jgi:hypothetical protein
MKINIKIFKTQHPYNIPDEIENKYEYLLNLIENEIKISKEFFFLKIINNTILDEKDFSNIPNNSIINLCWRLAYFQNDLKSLRVVDKEYKIPETILLESNVIRIILCDSDEETFRVVDEDDNLVFNTENILDKKSINHWINLSCEIKSFISKDNQTLSDLKIPKPLQNKKINTYIGDNAYNYLDNLDFEDLKRLATLTDFLDISYLLEIVCAFIAEKHVKNNTIENIKKIFDNVDV